MSLPRASASPPTSTRRPISCSSRARRAPRTRFPSSRTPPEPPGKVKVAKEVKAIDSDLEAIAKQHDALRAAFPPSAKAVADAEAAKAAKAKTKTSRAKSPIPRFALPSF